MNHADIELLLADYRDLRGAERRDVDAHVAACTSCAVRLAEYRAIDGDLQSLQDARPAPALRAAYYEAVERNGQGSAARRTPVPRTQARRTRWFYGIASVGAVLLLVVAIWMVLRPNLAMPGRPQSQGVVPAAKSTEVGSFVWQTDGVYGYEMLGPAGWSIADLGTARSYATSIQGSSLELVAINLAARAYDESSPEGFRDIKARFEAAPNLADWVKSAEEMWANYGPPITWIAEAPNAVIFQQQYDPTSRVAVTLIALVVKDGQPLILLLNAGGQYGSLEALQSRGMWDDFLTMIDSASPIPPDTENVQPWAPTATPTSDAPRPAVTPAPTALPAFTPAPSAEATLDPRFVLQPSRDLIEENLSRAVLGPLVANRVCDWTVLGRDERSIYVWTYCAAYLNAPDITAASMPAVLAISDDGTGFTVRTPRDGSYYPEDVRALFPPALQQMIFDRTFEPVLPELERHSKLRLKLPGLPPAGASEIAPLAPDAPTASGTVRIFSGRPDPAWTLTHRELTELDRLLLPLASGQCPPLPDRLGYRGVQVSLGMAEAGKLIAADGFVQSGDAGMNADAICLSDPDRSVERFLLSSAQASIDDEALRSVLSELPQPVPTPLVTPAPTPVLPPG